MDTAGPLADEAWLEQDFGTTETLTANGNNVAIWQLIGLLLVGTLGGCLHFCVKVKSNVAKLLLDIAHNLALSGCCERVATLSENLHEVLREVTAGKVETQDGVRERVSLIDGHGVGDTITRIHHNSSGAA